MSQREISQLSSGEAFDPRQVRLSKLEHLRQRGLDPYQSTKFPVDHLSADIIDRYDELEGQSVAVAGRIMALRTHGRAAFLDVYDSRGRIQCHVTADGMGEESFQVLDDLDLGDIVGISGTVFKTRRGEVTVEAQGLQVLSKSLRDLPDKRHGLKDVDLRYRQRYLDLLANPEVRDTFRVRSETISYLRRFFDERGFIEVETPVLLNLAGGTEARPFSTHHNALDMTLYLRIALELHLKRLIVGGYDKVYEIGRVFRNEGISTRHNPEFTMLELYQAYTDFEGIMALVEAMLAGVSETLLGSTRVSYQGQVIDFTPPYARVDLVDRLRAKTGVEWRDVRSDADAHRLARQLKIAVDPALPRAQVMDKVVSVVVEPDLVQPTFLWHHPVDISPLAKRDRSNPDLTERFELFVAGRELANAFSELNDPLDQRERFLEQQRQRLAGNDETHPFDEDFLNALEHGMPPTGGLGVGIDRLVMLLTDSASIRDVVLFPTMRTLE